MTIKDIAHEFNTSVRQIGIKFGIPQRTVENWSAGVNNPPDYVLNLIHKLMTEENEKQK